MRSWITSEGVLVVEAENSTELFAMKNTNKVLLMETMPFSCRSIQDIVPPKRWSKIVEIKDEN